MSKQYHIRWRKCQKYFYVTHWQKKFLTYLTLYLYTFSQYENASLIIFSAETEYISTRYWYRNINFLKRYGIKGNLLQWLGSYISAREQQIIIKNAISGKGNLKAVVPEGFILGPLLFLIFIKGKGHGLNKLVCKFRWQ